MKKILSVEIRDAAFTDLIFEGFERFNTHFSLNASAMKEALKEVIENILFHAYDEPERFLIKTVFSLDAQTFRIDVTDTGIPFDFSRYRSESLSIPPDHSKGFYRIYDLIDRFYFANITGIGKCFTLINSIDTPFVNDSETKIETLPYHLDPSEIRIRHFKPEDAEGIARLIYRNYDFTYYKAFYYDADAIRSENQKETIHSIVAEYKEEIVGHFAMIPSSVSNLAEIGAAVVDPRFKRMGIMNHMFDQIVSDAHAKQLNALYGEGMMLHPYSQKANLGHGMIESAILLGEVPSTMEIEHQLKNSKRSGVVVAFLLFDQNKRSLILPKRYREMVSETYRNGGIEIVSAPMSDVSHQPSISYRINPLLKTGTIVIESNVSGQKIDAALDVLLSHHCDMLFADINLHRIHDIDSIVRLLNQRLFFYSGVMFDFYHNEDYLRLQRKNALVIEEEQLICHSPFSQKLLTFILRDEESLSPFQEDDQ